MDEYIVVVVVRADVSRDERAWVSPVTVSTSTKPICDDRSLLLTKEASINTSRLREFRSSGTKVSPLAALSICH